MTLCHSMGGDHVAAAIAQAVLVARLAPSPLGPLRLRKGGPSGQSQPDRVAIAITRESRPSPAGVLMAGRHADRQGPQSTCTSLLDALMQAHADFPSGAAE